MTSLALRWQFLAAMGWVCPQIAVAQTDLAQLAKAPPGQKHSYGADAHQFGELTLPEGKGPHPVVINIHGGCWLSEYNIDHSRALANALAKSGIAVWNLEYRRVGDSGGGWPGTFLDVSNGADYLRTLAKEHPIDLSRVVLMGHSAGGHFALWLAARHKIPATAEVHTKDPIAILGVIGLAPAPQLDALHQKGVCNNVIDKLMDGAPDAVPGRYHLAMPAALAPIGVPQTLIIGKKDAAWGWVGQSYADKARAAGDTKIEVIIAADAGHFEVIDPNSSTWAQVLESTQALLDRK
jgi:acetyl esterase/lipase